MRKQKIHCVVVDQDAEVTASLEAVLRNSDVLPTLKQVASLQQLIPILQEIKPHLLFYPKSKAGDSLDLLEILQNYSPDTLLVLISRNEWQGLTTWLMGVESCILPIDDAEYFSQYIDFLLRYSGVKHDFRQCKHLLGVAELRCHWLVDYSWEAIAYISQGMHLYANNAYISLFGFESIAEVRSMPVAQLVDSSERKTFGIMGKAADTSSQPSNRLLTTLRTLDGERMRAEIRFIPAVLKGKRCSQLHVRPLERHIGKGAPLWKQDNPWEGADERIHLLPESRTPPTPAASAQAQQPGTAKAATQAPPLDGLKMLFHKLHRLREKLPTIYTAEPEFQQQPNKKVSYASLVRQLGATDSRFRLDYWSLGQIILKLSSQGSEKPDYLVFVSVGGTILNNESQLKLLISLLNAAPAITNRIVVALQYEDCLAHMGQLGKLIKLLRAVGVSLAIDGVPDDIRAIRLVQVVKPSLVRLSPDVAAIAVRKAETGRIQRLIYQLAANMRGVIVPGVQNKAALQVVYSSAAAYVQGSVAI